MSTMTDNRRPRSSQAEMDERTNHVLSALATGPKTIREIFQDTSWTYPQQIITLRRMNDECLIAQVGKRGREIVYDLPSQIEVLEDVAASRIAEHLQKGQNSLSIVGLMFTDNDGFVVDMEFPDGEVVTAHLVA